jgi:hypothetical protein
MQVNARTPRRTTPLSTWFAGPGAEERFRRRTLGRAPAVLVPRDAEWRSIAPGVRAWPAIAAEGLPFQIAADRRYDRSGDPRRLGPALAAGKTVFFPQIHQVLPRLARLMVGIRSAFAGPGREECSFLFLVQGRGREGLGLHHDGDVDAFWLQLAGRRTVTIGPPAPRGAPEDLPDDYPARWPAGAVVTLSLAPGTLFYMPPRTPHRVVCHGRSLAVSLTWGRRVARGRRGAGLTTWDVVSGRVDRTPPASRARLWTQVPATVVEHPRGHGLTLSVPDGVIDVPAVARPMTRELARMPSWRLPLTSSERRRLSPLVTRGILAPRDLPRRIVPADPRALDGWRFA